MKSEPRAPILRVRDCHRRSQVFVRRPEVVQSVFKIFSHTYSARSVGMYIIRSTRVESRLNMRWSETTSVRGPDDTGVILYTPCFVQIIRTFEMQAFVPS